MRKGAVNRVSEVALWTKDLDEAKRFYLDRLGFEVVDEDAGCNAFLRSGDFLLVLFDKTNPNTALANAYLERKGGPRGEVYHLAFQIDPAELDESAESLRTDGLEVSGPVEFASGRRSYFVEDPDEHWIELTDR